MGPAVVRLIEAIFASLAVRDFEGELTIGLDDPADTGMLMGVLIPTSIALSWLTGRSFTISPSFERVIFEGRGSLIVRFSPVQVLPAIVRFLFSIPAFRAVKRVIASRWKRER
jgi:hypothetical protein